MKVNFMYFMEMAITEIRGLCSYLTIAWAVPNQYILGVRSGSQLLTQAID